jgi:hypothetical protein
MAPASAPWLPSLKIPMTSPLELATPDLADTSSQARARELTLQLRALQDSLNRTIDQLCELAAAGPGRGERAGVAGWVAPVAKFTPTWLDFPVAQPVVSSPQSGQSLGDGAVLYTDARGALLQILQQPLTRVPGARYGLDLQFARFDGEWLSVVFDASSLLGQLRAGPARLTLLADVVGTPVRELQLRCHWSGDTVRGEKRFVLRQGQLNQAQALVEYLDPAQLSRLELHLVFTLPERGALTVRRLDLRAGRARCRRGGASREPV